MFRLNLVIFIGDSLILQASISIHSIYSRFTRRKSLNSSKSSNTGGEGNGGPNKGTDSAENTRNL